MFLFLLTTLLLMLGVRWWLSDPFHWKKKGLPYQIPFPLIGATVTTLFLPFYKFWFEKYSSWAKAGPMFGFHFFENPALFISDPEIIKEVCVNQADKFMSHGFYISPRDTIRGNVFHADSTEWKFTRAAITPHFTPSRIKLMIPIIRSAVDRISETLENFSKHETEFDIHELYTRLTTDITVSTAFGVDADSIRKKDNFYYNIQHELLSPTTTAKMMLSQLSPWLYDQLKLTFCSKKTTATLKDVISEIVRMRESGQGVRPDLIQGFITCIQTDKMRNKENDGSNKSLRFDLKRLLAQAIIIYIGGTETTANTLSFLFYEMTINQEIQNKIRKEICELLAQNEGNISMEQYQTLKYTNMCISEAIRKYPVVPFLPRKCTQKTVLNGVPIEKGTMIVIPTLAMQRDSKYYPDPDKFLPERFSTPNTAPNYTFGMGARLCIGMRLANVEMMEVLIKVMPEFKFLKCSKTPDKLEFSHGSPSLSPKNGLFLKVEKINNLS